MCSLITKFLWYVSIDIGKKQEEKLPGVLQSYEVYGVYSVCLSSCLKWSGLSVAGHSGDHTKVYFRNKESLGVCYRKLKGPGTP